MIIWLYVWVKYDFGSRGFFFPVPIKCIQIFILFIRRHEYSRRRVARRHDVVRCFLWHRGCPSFIADVRWFHADDPGSSFERIYLSARCAILKSIPKGIGKSFWRRLWRIVVDKTGLDKGESKRVYKWTTRAALERDMRFLAENLIARLSSDIHRHKWRQISRDEVCVSTDLAGNIFVLVNRTFIYISCNEIGIGVINNNIL